MRGTGIMLILVGLMLGVFGVLMDTSRATFIAGAVVLVAVGLALFVIAQRIGRKQSNIMAQFQQMQQMSGADPQMAGVTDMTSLEPMALLKSVMDAQNQAGGDPEKMASILQQQFGGTSPMVDGTSLFQAGSVGENSNDPIALLATLTELHEKGVLTDEQFEQQKTRLLGD